MYGKFPDEKSLFSREDIPDKFIDEVKKSANLFFQLQAIFYLIIQFAVYNKKR
jgi:hypothetical protein